MRRILSTQHLLLSLKLVLAVILFWVILRGVDVEQMLHGLTAIPPLYWAAILGIPLLQASLLGLRWLLIARAFGHHMIWSSSVVATLVSFFFSQGLPASIGGDAFRIWWQSRTGTSVAESTMVVMIDRLVGFFTLVLLTAVSLFFLGNRLENEYVRNSLTVMVAAIFGVFLVAAVVSYFDLLPAASPERQKSIGKAYKLYAWCRDCLSFMRRITASEGALILATAIVVHLMTTLMIFIAAAAITETTFLDVFAASTPALLVSYLPISIAGWGVREASIVAGFAIIGISAEVAFPVSIIVGLAVLAISLVGGAYWVFGGLKDVYFRTRVRSET